MPANVLDGQSCWIVGQALIAEDGVDHGAWLFQGVFATEELAVVACVGRNYFVGPATLNEALPNEAEDWPGHYYPWEARPDEGAE